MKLLHDARASRVRPFRRVFLLALLLGPTLTAVWANPALVAPTSVTRGNEFSVSVHPLSPSTAAEFKLIAPNGRTALDVPGFRLDFARDIETWTACLAVASTAEVGNYSLEISLHGSDGDSRLSAPIRVVDRSFIHEDIPLDAALTDLRETPDPRKVAEAEEILAILAGYDVGGQYWYGELARPVTGARITAHFGDRRRYLYSGGEVANAIHFGMDLALPEGSPVVSDGNGVVMFAGPRIVSGNTVVVEHLPGVYSLYYHLSRIIVKKGDRVETGDPVGKVGMTGLATGPHLHWEVRVDGIPVDPEELVTRPLVDKAHILATILSEPVAVSGETEKPSR